MTHDRLKLGKGEHSLQFSAALLLWFGREGLLVFSPRITDLINDEGVCRIALDTPGLLNKYNFIIRQWGIDPSLSMFTLVIKKSSLFVYHVLDIGVIHILPQNLHIILCFVHCQGDRFVYIYLSLLRLNLAGYLVFIRICIRPVCISTNFHVESVGVSQCDLSLDGWPGWDKTSLH